MSGMPTPIVSSGIGVMSETANVCFGVRVWNELVVVVVLPPSLAVAVTVYLVAGLSARLDFHCWCAWSKAPATCAPPPWTATVPSLPLVALTTIGDSGRLSAAPLTGVIETFAADG